MKHSKFAPSSSPRWANCTKSFYRHEQDGDGWGSIYAYEGTICHDIAAKVLTNEAPLNTFLGYSYDHPAGPIVIDETHIDAIQVYIDIIYNYQAENTGSKLYVEQKVTANDESWGTSDAILHCPRQSHLHVFDLKMGRGVQVNAENNEQMISYGMGSLNKIVPQWNPLELPPALPDHITLHIVQPRLPSGRVHDQHTMSAHELIHFYVEKLEGAIQAINKGEEHTTYNPGEKQCRWCSYSPHCSALATWTLAQAGLEFKAFIENDKQAIGEQLGMTNLDDSLRYSDKELSNLVDSFQVLEIWMKSLREEAHKRAMELARKGDRLPNFKLVESTKHRKWRDEHKAEELLLTILGDEAYKRKILSPAQAEKAVSDDAPSAEDLFALIHKPKGNPVLVPEKDRRPEMTLSAESEFENYAKAV